LTDTGPSPRLRFGGIEAARGVAAVLVAGYHGARLVAQPRYAGLVPAGGLFGDFNVGVDFFFVLSGFLITWVHWADIGRPDRIGHYAMRRVTRIYPAYWLVLVPMLVARLFHVGSTATTLPLPWTILCSLFLLPNAVPPILGVAWTLVFEMLFYVLFGLAMLAGRRSALIGAGLWAATIVAGNIIGPPSSFPGAFLLSPYNLEFLLGVGAASLLKRRRVPAPPLVAACGAVAFIGLMLFRVERLTGESDLAFHLIFGACAAMFVLGTVELERSGRAAVPAWLALLGAASYAIYLVHSVVEPVALLAAWRWIAALPPRLITVALMAVGTAAGVIFHLLVERPLMLVIRRALRRRAVVPA
jgi:peptidoglycan/LPS O-acetylase OafA/YrhL